MRKLWLLGLLPALLVSCRENETPTPDDPGIVYDYMPMKAGNYWVYNHYRIDTSGNATDEGITDSIVITDDTLINGKRYFVFEGTNNYNGMGWGLIDCLRDSSGYIVNAQGIIKFSATNFTDTLYTRTMVYQGDTLYTLSFRMEKPDTTITVPAGVFGVLNYRGTLKTPWSKPLIPNPRFVNHYYADNVGKVLETYFFLNSPNYYEMRLIRYKADKE
jgi:hypothetical protein